MNTIFKKKAKKQVPHCFSYALLRLKKGELLTRIGWNGTGMYIALQAPDKKSKMNLPYIYIRTVAGNLVPWVASQSDLLAVDWVVIETK